MILPIYVYGQPVLRKVAEDIAPDYPNLKELIEKLPFPQEKILTAIRFLADQDSQFTLSDGYLSHEDSAK